MSCTPGEAASVSEQLHQYYDDYWTPETHPDQPAPRRVAILLQQHLFPGAECLDVGCGDGRSAPLSGTDTAAPSITGALTVTIHAASAASLSLATPASATANQPFDLGVTLLDAFGNVADGYTGTVQFSSSDPLAQLPADYPFTGADAGSHTFTVTLVTPTPGSAGQTITATDPADASLSATSPPIVVNAA